jgi:predicted transcriptional regulator
MAAGITTSIRMPEEVRDLYETIAQATGRTKNDVMVEVLRAEGERRVEEIAMILEGREQARAGRISSVEDVVARFKQRGMLPPEFDVNTSDNEGATGA